MDVCISKISKDNSLYWVFYNHGKFTQPIMILNDYEFQNLIATRQDQLDEEE